MKPLIKTKHFISCLHQKYVKLYWLFLCAAFMMNTLMSCASHKNIDKNYDVSELSAKNIFNGKNFQEYKFKKQQVPSPEHLSIIWFILSNTGENNIHQMRGEKDNKVFISKSDEHSGYIEAVYDANGKLVTNSYNKGSYNYYYYKTHPIMHFLYDSLPWLELGNDPNDPTSFKERLFHYTFDLNYGIQTFIFMAKSEDLPNIDFHSLSDDEKLVYQFFNHILFSDEYRIKLNKQNREKLKKDSEFYWKYFYQIQDLLNIRQ